jgi:hypothetical protein
MVPPRGRPSPVQGTVGGAGLHRGKPPTGQVLDKCFGIYLNLREGEQLQFINASLV